MSFHANIFFFGILLQNTSHSLLYKEHVLFCEIHFQNTRQRAICPQSSHVDFFYFKIKFWDENFQYERGLNVPGRTLSGRVQAWVSSRHRQTSWTWPCVVCRTWTGRLFAPPCRLPRFGSADFARPTSSQLLGILACDRATLRLDAAV